jgi:hypothetical protein
MPDTVNYVLYPQSLGNTVRLRQPNVFHPTGSFPLPIPKARALSIERTTDIDGRAYTRVIKVCDHGRNTKHPRRRKGIKRHFNDLQLPLVESNSREFNRRRVVFRRLNVRYFARIARSLVGELLISEYVNILGVDSARNSLEAVGSRLRFFATVMREASDEFLLNQGKEEVLEALSSDHAMFKNTYVNLCETLSAFTMGSAAQSRLRKVLMAREATREAASCHVVPAVAELVCAYVS